MKTTIAYFTGTGNSLAVARQLAQKLSDTTIVSVGELLQCPCPAFDSSACGFVFPVYCQNVPEIVRRLARRIRIPADAYVFAVATHNGDVGFSHYSLDRILRKQGRRLWAGFAVLMPGNSVTPYDSTNGDDEIQRRLHQAGLSIEEIAELISNRASRPFYGSDSLRKHLKGMRNMFHHKIVFKVPERFSATEACNRCRICVRICPEENIRLKSDGPEWGNRCQMCLACLHWCPERAIQNGPDTARRRRYHHPDVTVGDMIVRA